MRISDWSSDVCSSDLSPGGVPTCLRRLRLARRLLSSTVMQLTPDLLLRAYAIGIFPMAESRIDPELHWIDPDMRGILPLDDFRLPRKLRAKIRRGIFEVRCNSAFQEVIRGCAEPAENRPDTWINPVL